ncbi:MAG: mersacidin/lichenicidin family type 2 lantibiotic [Leptolyngbyaceae cyanobacterium SU_3_3]|nr:mersacidin/lichenicidin family type 2 lantibiotic [Leptolyngbyaceae cyanobacterium SU_3_3]
MSHENIIRAWKDARFRDGLSETERSLLPEHPAGLTELADADLVAVGGMTGPKCWTMTGTVVVRCETYD